MKGIGATLLLLAAASALTVAAWLGIATTSAVSRGESGDAVIAGAAVSSLVIAAGAVVGAVMTILLQRWEAERQRQADTLRALTEKYELIFDEIYSRQGSRRLKKPEVIEHYYNRYFTAIMTGFRYYQRGLIAQEDFIDWTATLIGRFRAGSSVVDLATTSGSAEMRKQWRVFNRRGAGPRGDFLAYMARVLSQAREDDVDLRACAQIALKGLRRSLL
jgi:hypothetical protein